MKKQIFTLLFSLLISSVFAQNYYLAAPEGYGATATGGGNAIPVIVSTYTAFKNALNSTTAANAVILVSGTIDCTYTSVSLTNKTIIGLPGARLKNVQITQGNSTTSAANSGILYIKAGSNNVIIRNLIFEGPGAYDVDGRDNLTNEGTNVWVDHCEFQDGMDGNFDNKGEADNVSISWCKFTYLKPAVAGGSGGSNDHRFSNLVGSSASDAPATDGHYSITFENCYWATGCKERMPRARNAELHLLNCYYNVAVTGSLAIGLGGGMNNTTCYVENSNFANITNKYSNYSGDGGTVAINFSNCLNGASNVGTVTVPAYSYTKIPVTEVASRLSDTGCGAGATLQVTNTGIMSPGNCTNLSVSEGSTASEINISPSRVKNNLKVILPQKSKGKLSLEIFSASGQKILGFSKKISGENSVNFDVESLISGIYYCTLKLDSFYYKEKFVKE